MATDSRRHQLQRIILISTTAGFLAACATAPQPTTAVDEPIDLTGDWVINRDLSDRPSDVVNAATRETTSPLGLIQRFGGIISVYGISAGDVASMIPGGDEQQEIPEFPPEITDPMTVLKVVQMPGTVEVDYDSTTTVLYQDGDFLSDEEQHYFAVWQEDAFAVERQPREGLAFSETFELVDDRNLLVWVVTFEMPDGDEFVITRVYEPRNATPSELPANAPGFVASSR
jgi:hypothetical protein